MLESRYRTCVAAALLSAPLLGGCGKQLALHDSYFGAPTGVERAYAASAQRTVTDGRSMQTLQAACVRAASAADPSADADLDAAGGRKALDELCAYWRSRPPEARGAIDTAYRRWVEDNLRRMQTPSTTAASPGGS